MGPVAVDADGNIYGSTLKGGDNDAGLVYLLQPKRDGSYQEWRIYQFAPNGPAGMSPGPVVEDAWGNLLGVSTAGVFELTRQARGVWSASVLYSNYSALSVPLTISNGSVYDPDVIDVFNTRAFLTTHAEPPPQMFAAAVTAIDGIIGSTFGLAVGIGMLVHWIDPSVAIDPLWAKNLIYQFGHTFANLTMYIAVAGVYVGLPLCTKRDYHTSKPLVVAWWGTLLFVIIAYFHHLYMDFAQAETVQFIGEIASYLAAIPVVVVTVFSGAMLVHRSGLRWSLGSMFLYAGMIGWVVGGTAAVLDATIPVNLDLHNTLWVPGHFHTYLLQGVLLFIMGWAFVNLEQRSGEYTSLLMRWLIGASVFGGAGLFLISFYIAGASGVPRRYAVEPGVGPFYAGIATIGALILLCGLVVAGFEAARLARLAKSAQAMA